MLQLPELHSNLSMKDYFLHQGEYCIRKINTTCLGLQLLSPYIIKALLLLPSLFCLLRIVSYFINTESTNLYFQSQNVAAANIH